MNFRDFEQKLSHTQVFSLGDIRKFEPSFSKNRLVEWVDKNYLVRLRRNRYTFSNTSISSSNFYRFANKIYSPSYISLETGLSYYNLIPETVYSITSVTTRKTQNFDNKFGKFTYQTVRKELFWGYDVKNVGLSDQFLIAEPEKLILDYLYLHQNVESNEDYFELRFNFEEFKKIYNKTKLENYTKMFENQALTKKIISFINYHKNA